MVKPDAAIQRQQVGTAEDLTAAEWMFDMVKTIAPSARKPNFAGWANDIRLMRERDGRKPPRHVRAVPLGMPGQLLVR